MNLFDLIKGIKAAKIQGLKINTYCASVKALKGTLRSMIFKYWNRVVTPQVKTITVIKDARFSNIFNIVTEQTNVADFAALGFITFTQFETLSAKGVNVAVVVL